MQEHVIIVAGGTGDRMGGAVPKQFLDLAGKPVIFHTIQRFIDYREDIEIVIVMHPEYMDFWTELCGMCHFGREVNLVSGGAERFYSVKCGLDALSNQFGIVAVHDAVRPLASVGTIERCFNAAGEFGSAIPIVPVIDSLRVINDLDNHPVDRSRFRLVQTPQCFEMSLLREAYNQTYRPLFTDDASVVEALGHKMHLVQGNRENIKLTTPADMEIARAILQK